MPITPIAANIGRLRISYSCNSLSHVTNLFVNIDDVLGTSLIRLDGAPIAPGTFVTGTLLPLVRAFYAAGQSSFNGWEVSKYLGGGAWQPTISGTLALSGTGGGSTQVTSQLTYTFRDVDYKVVKHVWAETQVTNPSGSGVNPASPEIAAYIASAIDNTPTTTQLGSIVFSRSQTSLVVSRGWQSATNKKLLRLRNY